MKKHTFMSVATVFALVAMAVAADGTSGANQGVGAEASPSYSVIDLTPGADFGAAFSINGRGDVVGSFYSPDAPGVPQGFVWSRGTLSSLVVPDYDLETYASDINDGGAIVGTAISETTHHGYVAVQDGIHVVSELDSAAAINNSGRIAGTITVDGMSHAALYDQGTAHDLGTLFSGTANSVPADINNNGTIVGTSWGSGYGSSSHAFLYSAGTLRDLGTLGGRNSYARAINDEGDVVGDAYTATSGSHAFLYQDGVMHDLGTLSYGLDFSGAFGINNDGDVVGNSGETAVLWSQGNIVNLNQAIPWDSGWVLSYASAINARGEIIGAGLKDGKQHAFLLIPQS
jgi:probable HAF family extracellular repeat protein